MKSIRFIDRPVRVPRAFYEDAVADVIQSNRDTPGLLSIYRFGNVNVPGISDLDILFVFKDGSACPLNGLEKLPDRFRPLFTHGIMAMSQQHFDDNFRFTIWSKAECIWGKPLPEPQPRTEAESELLNGQTAVEFLMANYIDFSVQSTYRVFKLRSMLQHMKGLAYDMELLRIKESSVHPLIERLNNMVLRWHEETPSDTTISDWLNSFSFVFPDFLNRVMHENPLTLPIGERYTIASNMVLTNGDHIQCTHSGWLPSPVLSVLGRNYFKLLHRTNRFLFTCPIKQEQEGFLADRFRFLQRMKNYNRQYLPKFMTMTPSINAKII